jgi:hypothetical protein
LKNRQLPTDIEMDSVMNQIPAMNEKITKDGWEIL